MAEPYIDALIDFPVEVEGSPLISTDEVTASMHIKRSYAVAYQQWVRLAYNSRDPQFTTAPLVNEAGGNIQGGVLFFSRNYSEIPAARVEPREIAFTLPGRSAVQISSRTGGAIGWNPYGAVAPQTVPKLARVEYSYAAATSLAQNPATLFTPVTESALTYQGARVDFSGAVYVSVGDVSIPQGLTNPPLVEPRWQFQGIVGGFFSGQDWIVSVNITRWRGPIFQREVVKIPTLILP